MEDKAYIGRTDEELIERYKAGDTQAIDALIVRYKKLVKKNARALYLIGGEHDDLIQEGMIGLYKAVRNYDSQKNASFQPFANLCISSPQEQERISRSTIMFPLTPQITKMGNCQEFFSMENIHSNLEETPKNL